MARLLGLSQDRDVEGGQLGLRLRDDDRLEPRRPGGRDRVGHERPARDLRERLGAAEAAPQAAGQHGGEDARFSHRLSVASTLVRMAGRGLVEVEDARRAILAAAAPPAGESVALGVAALGRVLGEDVVATHPVPAFDNSAMDGFAVRAPDLAGAGPGSPVKLRLVGESRAGSPATAAVGEGQAIAISTGAMMPDGADTVLRVEETELAGSAVVQAMDAPEPGRNVRRAGEDVLPGQTVLRTGTVLGPAELGVLASLGRSLIRCVRRPRVSVLVTGDELLGLHEAPRAGAIRDTSTLTISALACCGGAEVVRTGRAGDDAAATREAAGEALEGVDIAVVCGGVSVGAHDHVRPSLAELGVKEEFWGLALKPGSPAWFGRREDTLVFGLPGNPVSAMVTFVLARRAGAARDARPPARAGAQGGDPRPRLREAGGPRPCCALPLEHARGRPARDADGAAGFARVELDARRGRAGDDPERDDAGARREPRGGRVPARVDPSMSPVEEIDVEVRLFAMLRERAGAGTRELRLPAGATVADALERLAAQDAPLGELLARLPVSTAVNREYAAAATVLQAGDELALIPPVSGGAEPAAVHAAVSEKALSAERLTAVVADPRAGAIVVFQGVTREIAALDYEAYAEMAREQIESILRECVRRHGLCVAAAEHRVGRVALGEPSVIVAVSAPHREEAFAGARMAIDEIKAQAPIWKREDGGSWVEGAAPEAAPERA